MSLCEYVHVNGGTDTSQKKALGSPGGAFVVHCELLNMGAGNRTGVLCKSSK